MTQQQLAERIVQDCLDYIKTHYPEHLEVALSMESTIIRIAKVLVEDQGVTPQQYTMEFRFFLLGEFDKSFRSAAGLEA